MCASTYPGSSGWSSSPNSLARGCLPLPSVAEAAALLTHSRSCMYLEIVPLEMFTDQPEIKRGVSTLLY